MRTKKLGSISPNILPTSNPFHTKKQSHRNDIINEANSVTKHNLKSGSMSTSMSHRSNGYEAIGLSSAAKWERDFENDLNSRVSDTYGTHQSDDQRSESKCNNSITLPSWVRDALRSQNLKSHNEEGGKL